MGTGIKVTGTLQIDDGSDHILIEAYRLGLERLGEAGVQPLADLLPAIGGVTPLCSGDQHPRGGDTVEARHAQDLPPAHLSGRVGCEVLGSLLGLGAPCPRATGST